MVYEFVDNRLVSSDHLNIAEIVQDYDPNLELCWIPPGARVHGEDPWAVFHTHKGKRYLVRTFAECDHRILAYLWDNDTSRTNVLTRLDAEDAARKAIKLKQDMEAAEERQDMIKSVLRTPYHTYKLPSGTVIRANGDNV
jgi:hypothetical protein